MSENYIKLYDVTGAADSVYFLAEGSVYFYASNVDKYAISGRNLIIGSTEIIMKHLLGTETGRIETAVADGSSAVKKISVEKFVAGLKTYSFALNASMVLAKQVMLTGQMLQKNLSDLEGDEKKVREYSIAYYAILQRLHAEYNKRRLPWIKELADEFGDSLTGKKGEAYSRSLEPATMVTASALSDKEIEFQRGAIICEENAPGSEMYILKSGAIDVFVKGSRISTIDGPGTVFGESSLLLGEKRAATLTAKNRVILARIRKEDLKEVAEKQEDFLSNIATSLARRHYFNVTKLENVNRSLAVQAIDREESHEDRLSVIAQRAHHDLSALRARVEDIVREKKADFLNDLVEKF